MYRIILIIICMFCITSYADEIDQFGQPIVTTINEADVPLDTGFIPVTSDSSVVIPQVILPTVVIPSVDKVIVITPEIFKTLFDGDYSISSTSVNVTGVGIASNYVPVPTVGVQSGSMLEAFGVANGYVPVVNTVTAEVSYLNQVYSPLNIYKVTTGGEGVTSTIAGTVAGLANETSFLKTDHPRNFVQDKRTVNYAQNKVSTNKVWAQWKAIYSQSYQQIEYIPVVDVTKIKMITEMRVAESEVDLNNLLTELKYFKSIGYNSILAVWEGKQLSALLEQIELVKGLGYKVYFTFGTREKLQDAIFIDVDLYKYGIGTLASYCDGYLIGWRRTSLHLFKPDKQWVDFSLNCVRQGNPNILVFGEVYRGYVGNYNKDGSDNMSELLFNIPVNASGAFVVNFGVQGIRPDGVLKLIRSDSNVPLIAVIVGEKPYYMTTYNTNKTNKENREVINRIEERFRKFDFGTATLAGDGSNEVYNVDVSDDLCKMHWSK